MARASQVTGMALRRVRQRDKDVPGRGEGEEDREARQWMELTDAGDGGAWAAGEQQVEEDDCNPGRRRR